MCNYEQARNLIPNIDDFEKLLRSYSSPIMWPNFKDPLKTEFGNSTFVKIDEHFGVLTATHVADIFIKAGTNHVYIPLNDEKLEPLYFDEIIKLPCVEGWASPDLAFIKLANSQIVIDLGYKFYSLSNAKDEVLSIFPEKIDQMKCCAFLATPSEGKTVKELPGKTMLEYPLASFSLGFVQIGSYSEFPYYFPAPEFPDLQEVELRIDEFKTEITAKSGVPKVYTGTSGGGFWGAELSQNGDYFIYTDAKLLGVVIEQKNNILNMRGGVSIYKTFLTFCSFFLKTDNENDAIRKASAVFTKP